MHGYDIRHSTSLCHVRPRHGVDDVEMGNYSADCGRLVPACACLEFDAQLSLNQCQSVFSMNVAAVVEYTVHDNDDGVAVGCTVASE